MTYDRELLQIMSVNKNTNVCNDVKTELPDFDVTDWSPEHGSPGIEFLCLVPFAATYKSAYEESVAPGKVKTSTTHRQQRQKKHRSGEKTWQNIADGKRLQKAANTNDLTTVVELLEDGVDPCCSDEKNRTPLHFAASQGFENIVKVLLEKGADPNQKDILGNTALHLAVCTGQVPVVTLLLNAGTDLKSLDRSGRTPLSVAKSRLKFLMEDPSHSSLRIKKQMLEIGEMMKVYLKLSGMQEETEQLDALCVQLHSVSTREEVDHFNNLLSDFTSLTLEKNPP